MLLTTITYTYEASYHVVLLCICIVGTVKGCGYNGQHKYTICDTCRLCHLIHSIVRPVFRQIQRICCVTQVSRSQDLVILCGQQLHHQQRQTQLCYPLRMCAGWLSIQTQLFRLTRAPRAHTCTPCAPCNATLDICR